MNYWQRIRRLFKCVALCMFFVVIFNFYLIVSFANEPVSTTSIEKGTHTIPEKRLLSNGKSNGPKSVVNTTLIATHKINDCVAEVKKFFKPFEEAAQFERTIHDLLISRNYSEIGNICEIASKWVTKNHIIPSPAPLLQSVLHFLRVTPIKAADVLPKGSQLKILFTLEGGFKALFKPKWYEVDSVIKGSVYSGRDRHNGEIVSFHLARLLGLNRVPVVTIRNLNLNSEVLPVATSPLKKTFFMQDEATCFYGVCKYCNKENSICAKGGFLEGSVTLWLPEEWTLKKARHPWQRSYTNKPAVWEIMSDYCEDVKNSKVYQDEQRLLDLIEISIFDFLIDNGDRHHYEYFAHPQSKVLLIDNAKSFGNPFVDHIDILAPLYQCCRLRKSFLTTLVSFQQGALTFWLKKLLGQIDLEYILHKDHFTALDRRLNLALAAVMVCFEEYGSHNVIVNS